MRFLWRGPVDGQNPPKNGPFGSLGDISGPFLGGWSKQIGPFWWFLENSRNSRNLKILENLEILEYLEI